MKCVMSSLTDDLVVLVMTVIGIVLIALYNYNGCISCTCHTGCNSCIAYM